MLRNFGPQDRPGFRCRGRLSVGIAGSPPLSLPRPSDLFTGSADKSLQVLDVESGSILYSQQDAHKAGINALIHVPEMSVVATGCDGGTVKVRHYLGRLRVHRVWSGHPQAAWPGLTTATGTRSLQPRAQLWDLRERACSMSWSGHEDYISDLTCVAHKKTFLATSGDGTLSVMNAKKGSRKASDQLEEELMSVVVMKNNRKVVCGTSEGCLALYSVRRAMCLRRRPLPASRRLPSLCLCPAALV